MAEQSSAVVSLLLTTVGAGVLSYPLAAVYAGTPLFLAILLTLLYASYICSLVIADFAFAHRGRVHNFEELVVAVLGPRFYAFASAQVILGLLGCVVGFLCIAGDLGAQATSFSRAAVIFATALVLTPLSGCQRVHALRGVSALGIAGAVAVIALLVQRGAAAALSGAAAAPVAPASVAATLRAGACVLYAVGNQVVGTTIFFEANETTQRGWRGTARIAFFMIALLYVAAALGGAAAFGRQTVGDVLLNFHVDDAVANAAKVVMAVHVILVIPLDAVPLRRSLELAVHKCAGRGRGRDTLLLSTDGASGESADADIDESLIDGVHTSEPAEAMPFLTWQGGAQTALIIFVPAAIAVFFPQINVFFGIFGATLGVSGTFLFPALFLLQKARLLERAEWSDVRDFEPSATAKTAFGCRVQGISLLVLSLFSAITCTSICLYDLFV
jgi:amino acid permease